LTRLAVESSPPAVRQQPPPPRPSGPLRTIKLLGKHQFASIVATAIDYSLMIVMVSVVGLTAVEGTVIGAACGATANFTLGRYFTFRAAHRRPEGQAFRYILVSAASLGWNALGEHLLAVVLGLHYVIARLITGTLVSFLWNYPLQRYFVFK